MYVGLIALAVGACGYLLYEYGRFSSGYDNSSTEREMESLQSRLEDQELEIAHLAKQNEILAQGKEIDRLAYTEIDQTLTDLQKENMELKEEIAFYRGIVGTAEEVRGLQIRNFKLIKNDIPRNYRYRLILTQLIRGNRFVSGHVILAVSGVHNGIEKSLSQQEFVREDEDDMKFHFKYFQELQGEIVLPDGFVPLKITLSIIPQDNPRKTIEQTFNWADVIT